MVKKAFLQSILDTLYNDYHLNNKEKWSDDLHTKIKRIFKFDIVHNWQLHFEFLRHIMFQICEHFNNKDYLIFLSLMLHSILEENAISKEYDIDFDTVEFDFLSIPKIQSFFWDRNIKLSNARLKKLIDEILEGNVDFSICNDINQAIVEGKKGRSERHSNIDKSRPKYSRYSPYPNIGKGYKKRTKRTKRTKKIN